MSVDRLDRADTVRDPLDAAADWASRRRRGLNGREEQRFAEWLGADPAHKDAFDDVMRSWEVAGAMSSAPEILAMRSDAILSTASSPPPAWRRYGGIAAALVVVAGTGLVMSAGWFAGPAPAPMASASQSYRTSASSTTIALGDGSHIRLDPSSALEQSYSPGERAIRLQRGGATFDVAKDRSRPFTVHASDMQVTALGTKFSVRIADCGTRVALMHGAVRVDRRGPSSDRESDLLGTLNPGEQMFLRGTLAPVKTTLGAEPGDWCKTRLRLNETRLGDAVAEMNLYNQRQIIVADPAAAGLRISGAFRTDAADQFVAAMSDSFGLHVEKVGDGYILRSGR